ncbi:hypothetical protein [Actinokineospora terrae]|uniref:Uncharacterized protein n=1 Tax=Actinokineospora terrae TaxID=155974 RepID=A0A1H9MLZ1_9PSEU|nr:hypothetical protein [Actinokineospora terrae]SER24173.1 hypothetical protein SAMN04487818_102206 [Actinokineospora terrae]
MYRRLVVVAIVLVAVVGGVALWAWPDDPPQACDGDPQQSLLSGLFSVSDGSYRLERRTDPVAAGEVDPEREVASLRLAGGVARVDHGRIWLSGPVVGTEPGDWRTSGLGADTPAALALDTVEQTRSLLNRAESVTHTACTFTGRVDSGAFTATIDEPTGDLMELTAPTLSVRLSRNRVTVPGAPSPSEVPENDLLTGRWQLDDSFTLTVTEVGPAYSISLHAATHERCRARTQPQAPTATINCPDSSGTPTHLTLTATPGDAIAITGDPTYTGTYYQVRASW